jgi:hypothetical protein
MAYFFADLAETRLSQRAFQSCPDYFPAMMFSRDSFKSQARETMLFLACIFYFSILETKLQ